jgi:serine/threonine protein kinase
MAFSFVRCLVKHTLRCGGDALGGGIVPIGSIASAVYEDWCASAEVSAKDQAPPAAAQVLVRAELEKILQDTRAYRAQVDHLLGELGAGQSETARQSARTYLSQIPARVQRSLRRPEDPSGRTIPAGFVLRRAEDVQQLLPERMPRFRPGARPVPGTDLVVEELLGVGGFGEVWKARHQSRPHLPPVALKFCIDETAARTLRKEVELLDRVSQQGRHRGIVELRYAHLEGRTPCLEYEYVEGGDLACLVTDLHRAGKATPLTMTRLFYSLVQAVGFAHRIVPPIVHRDLKPTNVLTTRLDKHVVLKVLDFGIGGMAADRDQLVTAETAGQGPLTESAGTCTPLYASPQQRRGGGPDPRDDVYALGVIWYQMLVGDVTREPPRGGSWKKRLLDQGTTPSMLALLERCLEDDPADRPADAQVLAQELQAVIKQAEHQIKQGGHQGDPVPVPPSPESAPKGLAEARQLVKKPAIALLVVGILALTMSLIGLVVSGWTFLDNASFLNRARPEKEYPGLDMKETMTRYYQQVSASERAANVGVTYFFLLLVLSVPAGVASLAGWSMLTLRRYWLCLVGSFAVMPAAGLCFLVGIPVGIWSLLTLCKAEVRSAFR